MEPKKKSNVSYRSSKPSPGKTGAKKRASANRSTRPGEARNAGKKAGKGGNGGNRGNKRRAVDAKSRSLSTRNSSAAGNVRRKKRGGGCGGCLISFLIMIAIFAAIAFFGLRLVMGAAFDKIEKYNLDYDKIVVNDLDKRMSKDYLNIALFGVDNQDNVIQDHGSRTDCIMIASINKRTKDVKLMSVYRDTYVSIDGQYDKVNAAYAYGGPEQAINTLNRNLDLNIKDFATVNFKALADAVDALGGITLTVKSEKELKNLNDYIHNMNNINGGDSPKFEKPDEFPFTATFDGNQAVAYSRIRYMEGGDHERANHQRLVVQGIANAVKKKPWKIKELIDVVLPQCRTSMSNSMMTKLSMSLLRYNIVDSQGYPWDSQDEKYHGIYYGFPLSVYSNVVKAHEYLFGTKDYEPTEELGKISKKIRIVTDDIGL